MSTAGIHLWKCALLILAAGLSPNIHDGETGNRHLKAMSLAAENCVTHDDPHSRLDDKTSMTHTHHRKLTCTKSNLVEADGYAAAFGATPAQNKAI